MMWKLGDLLSPGFRAVNAKFCIFNLQSISQAGRRGFESRLPLHFFNKLQAIPRKLEDAYQGKQGNRGNAELCAPIGFQGLAVVDCQPARLDVDCGS